MCAKEGEKPHLDKHEYTATLLRLLRRLVRVGAEVYAPSPAAEMVRTAAEPTVTDLEGGLPRVAA